MPHSNLHIQKRRTNRAILIALFAFCALLFTLTLIKMSSGQEGNMNQSIYPIPEKYQYCNVDTICVLVPTTCDGCCQWGAVNKKHMSVFNADRDLYCKGYKGAVCDCVDTPATAGCIAERCAYIPLHKPSFKIP